MLYLEAVGKDFLSPTGETISVLKEVNMRAQKGEFIVIMGPSGCGKTTLLNIIAGLLQCDRGTVVLNGQFMSSLAEQEKNQFRNQHIGFIFQGSQLVQTLDLVDNVLLPIFFSEDKVDLKLVRKKALELLQKLGLGDRLDYLPFQLSIGQKRRAAIARALINEPEIIIADEPTSDLDPPRVKQVISILRELSEEGRILLASTHDEQVAEAADRCYIFHDGMLREG